MNALPPVLVAAGLAIAGPVVAQHATDTVVFAIERKRLPDALSQWSQVTGLQVISESPVLRSLTGNPVIGTYTPMDALRLLLADTQLTFTTIGERTVSIEPVAKSVTSRNEVSLQRLAATQTPAAAPASTASAGRTAADAERSVQEEVIVTAQKRSERLQDVPVPVTAVSAEVLSSKNQVLLKDYFTSVPSLSVTPSIQSQQTLSIRGITTGTGNPTVGITIDDVPFGSSTNVGGGRAVPDIDPGDLARIEVLRGPQGTLYGASSLGGLLKFVTVDPSTDEFAGRVQVGSTSVKNGDDLGYSVRASANVPLSETWAMRVSGFSRRDPGYIDNVQTGESAVNQVDAMGGRVAALWSPSNDFSLKLTALLQQIEGDGASSVDPPLGDLRQSRLRDSGWYDRDVQAYSAIATVGFGSAELTSITGYNINKFSDSFDLSYAFGTTAQTLYGVSGVALLSDNETKKLSQELRLSVPMGERFEWILGAFYTDEDSDLVDDRVAVNPATAEQVGRVMYSNFLTTFEEYAAFADLTYHITERFDVQFGARQSEIRQTYEQINISDAGVRTTIPELKTDGDALTYLVTPRYKFNDDVMVYARFASGYRAGGANISPGGVVPAQYDPDETDNYEIGIKAAVTEHLSVDASVYYIDWKDIQISLLSPARFTYTSNGSRARSQGVELAVQARPLDGLSISGWVAYTDAELSERLPPNSSVVGVSGDRLPNTSEWSGSLSVDQEFYVGDAWTLFFGGAVSYVGDRVGVFRATPVRQDFSSYTLVDLRAGLKNDSWSASLFGTNLGDKRGALYGGLGANPPTAFTYIQPRTIGVSLSKAF